MLKPPPKIATCKQCGKVFAGKVSKEFCSQSCQVAFHSENAHPEKFCPVCGAKHRSRVITCSQNCGIKLSSENQSETRLTPIIDSCKSQAVHTLQSLPDSVKQIIRQSLLNGESMMDAAIAANTSVSIVCKLSTMLCIQEPEFASAIQSKIQSAASVNAHLLSDTLRKEIEDGNLRYIKDLSIATGIFFDKSFTASQNQQNTIVQHHHFRHSVAINDDWKQVVDVVTTPQPYCAEVAKKLARKQVKQSAVNQVVTTELLP